MKFKLLFIFTLFFSALPLSAMDHSSDLDKEFAQAIKSGNVEQAESCLIRGANPDIRIRSEFCLPTPLIFAAEKGSTKIVKLLLEYDANVDIQGITKDSALITGALYGHATIVNILLKHGADIKIKNMYGTTALCPGNTDGIELILKHINHLLDTTDDPETCHMWDQYILKALNEVGKKCLWTCTIKITNAFRMLLHHADKLPLSQKKLVSLTTKALGRRYSGEEAFRRTVEHLRKEAF